MLRFISFGPSYWWYADMRIPWMVRTKETRSR